jgi:H+/Cl- antiporter ClcA
MFSKRFLISWLAASVAMFLLSYIWHKFVLTDFSRLSYPINIFLLFSAFVYLIIGFIVARAIDYKPLEKRFRRKPVFRGMIAGAVCGIVIFMVARVVGVSFSTGSFLENMLLDISWQMVEQTIGGMVVGIVHIFVFDPSVLQED